MFYLWNNTKNKCFICGTTRSTNHLWEGNHENTESPTARFLSKFVSHGAQKPLLSRLLIFSSIYLKDQILSLPARIAILTKIEIGALKPGGVLESVFAEMELSQQTQLHLQCTAQKATDAATYVMYQNRKKPIVEPKSAIPGGF